MTDHTELERRMLLLVTSLKGVLPEKAVHEVLHFIEHGEYGVALEELKYVYDQNVQSPSEEVLTEMYSIAETMKMKLE